MHCWREISGKIGRRSCSKVAYELMNEPVADDPGQWNDLIAGAIAVMRELRT